MKLFKNDVGLVLIVGFAMVFVPGRAPAQVEPVVEADLKALVQTDVGCCGRKEPVVTKKEARAFHPARIKDTMHGIWRGRVSGDYPQRLIAPDGYLNVNYFMVIDMKHGEALILEQLTSKRAVPQAKPGAPVWSFLTCGGQYLPPSPAQVHEFQKVSDDIEDARAMLKESTGINFSVDALGTAEPLVSAAWRKLVAEKYFDELRFPAFAGGLWKPIKTGNVKNEEGIPLFNLECQAEYRGGGITAALFQPGLPIRGTETARFVGVSIPGKSDHLVASLGNGVQMVKEATEGGLINAYMDKVTLGPLGPTPFAITDVYYDADKDEVTISWPSEAGKTFRIERSTDLKNWAEIGVVTGKGDTSSFTDNKLPGSRRSLYYRIRR